MHPAACGPVQLVRRTPSHKKTDAAASAGHLCFTKLSARCSRTWVSQKPQALPVMRDLSANKMLSTMARLQLVNAPSTQVASSHVAHACRFKKELKRKTIPLEEYSTLGKSGLLWGDNGVSQFGSSCYLFLQPGVEKVRQPSLLSFTLHRRQGTAPVCSMTWQAHDSLSPALSAVLNVRAAFVQGTASDTTIWLRVAARRSPRAAGSRWVSNYCVRRCSSSADGAPLAARILLYPQPDADVASALCPSSCCHPAQQKRSS